MMIILSKSEEDVLNSILSNFIRNDENYIRVEYNVFPLYTQNSIKDHLDNLKYKSYISSYSQTLSDVDIYLTPEGINYFVNKKIYQFPKNSMELLKEMLLAENTEDYLQNIFADIDSKRGNRLIAMIKNLSDDGYIVVHWADNIPYHIILNTKAYEYEERGFEKSNIESPSYNVENGNIYIYSTDNSSHIVNSNSDINNLFKEMNEIASKLQSDNKDQIIEAIKGMENYKYKPSFMEKYTNFIEVAANHMKVFAPFLPVLLKLIEK